MCRFGGSQPGIERSNRTVHCQHLSRGSPPAQFNVIGAATCSAEEDELAPTNVFSIRQSLTPSYPNIGDRDSDFPSKTIESDFRRMDGGRIMFPVRNEVFGVIVTRTLPESE